MRVSVRVCEREGKKERERLKSEREKRVKKR